MNIRNAYLGVVLFLLAGGCAQVRDTWRQSADAIEGAPRQRLANDLHAALHGLDGRGATLAARVVDLQTGQVLFEENPDLAVIPASNGKLAISAAGLDLFGPAHTFKTWLVTDGDDLWIVGSGDPGTGDARIEGKRNRQVTSVFDDWTAALKRRGITRVQGNLYYWDGAFDDQLVHPNWRKDFLVDWYAAPVSGLNFNDNCIDVVAHPAEEGQPARLEITPPNSVARVTNKTVTGGTDKVEITREPDAPSFTVVGGITKETKYESKPITDPGAFFAHAFRTHATAAGIQFDGQTIRAATLPFDPTGPMITRVVAVHETSIRDVLWRINKNSQNLFAEALSKAMGREMAYRRGQSVPGSWSLGEEAARAFLARNGIDTGQYVAADGSGLARENRVTSRLISDLLVLMHRHPYGKVWRDSLAVGGVDGTIGKRQKDIAGRIMAKTGYIRGVRSLSGYARTMDNRMLAFCFIYNDIEGDVKPYENLQDQACRVLVYWPKKAPRVAPEPATAPAAEPTTSPATQPDDAATQPTDSTPQVEDATTQPIYIPAPTPGDGAR